MHVGPLDCLCLFPCVSLFPLSSLLVPLRIGRSHTGYEWLIDMIREAESLDHSTGKLHLQVQMYITTPTTQFDLRTAMAVRKQARCT